MRVLYPAAHVRAARAIQRRLEDAYHQLGAELSAEIAVQALVLIDTAIQRECNFAGKSALAVCESQPAHRVTDREGYQ